MKTKRITKIFLIIFFTFTLSVSIYGIWIEPFQVEVRHLWINNTAIKKTLTGKTAVHISDLHIDKIGKREQKVLALISETRPDLIFLTGDYVKWEGDCEQALSFLSKLKAKIGIWAVMGDYDYSDSRKSCLFCHQPNSSKPSRRHHVKFLRNSSERIQLPQGDLMVLGIDEEFEKPFFYTDRLTSDFTDNTGIILSHNPLVFDALDKERDVLVLTGDTHGGQIPLPSKIWGMLGYEKNVRYNHGYFQSGKKKMVVSRGVGTSHFPIRILRRPEVVVLHF